MVNEEGLHFIEIVPEIDVLQKYYLCETLEMYVDERRLMIRSNNGFINRTGAKLAYGCDPISFENMTSRRILGMIFLYTINPRVFDFTAQDLFTNIIKEIVIPICLDI